MTDDGIKSVDEIEKEIAEPVQLGDVKPLPETTPTHLDTVKIPDPAVIDDSIGFLDMVKFGIEQFSKNYIFNLLQQNTGEKPMNQQTVNQVTNVLGVVTGVLGVIQSNLLGSGATNWVTLATGIVIGLIGYFTGKGK